METIGGIGMTRERRHELWADGVLVLALACASLGLYVGMGLLMLWLWMGA